MGKSLYLTHFDLSSVSSSYLVLVLLCSLHLSSASPLPKSSCYDKLKECEKRGPTRVVCGSDGRSYPTRCHLLRAACSPPEGGDPSLNSSPLKQLLTVKHRGPCTEQQQPCWSGRGSSEEGLAFVPKCLSDGRYAPVQCHDATGYCWCVTAQGKPLANTSVRGSRPKCNRRGKMRRGSITGTGRGKARRGCRRIDRALFINNLIKVLQTEYRRVPNRNITGTLLTNIKLAVEWKFTELDSDGNGSLTKDEYKDFRKLLPEVVKPRACSKSFKRQCDMNRDGQLSRTEWTTCIRKTKVNKKMKRPKKPKVEPPRSELDLDETGHGSILSSHLGDLGSEEPAERRDEPEANDCLSDRKSVLEEEENRYYVPECAPDGRYRKIQCYNSTGYCWCVHEDTGKPIPGTSVRDPNPQCDAVQPPSRPMKGCPDDRKETFLSHLMEFLRKSMHQSGLTNRTGLPIIESSVQNDQVATWHFQYLDTNKNKVLEQKEWKAFRTIIFPHKRLRKCGKRLPRYCDVNHDHKISMTEWFNCLNVNNTQTTRAAVTPSPKRRGPNPLESYLKDDD